MKYLAAYMLLSLSGNESPSAEDVTKLLSEVGVEVDGEEVSLLISKVEGKSLKELMAEGKDRLVSIGGGGAGAAAGGAGGAGAGAAAEEEKEEEEEEEVDVGGGGLFGGDDAGGY